MNKKPQPNILFLMTDQLQSQVFRPDHPTQTPNLDTLIERGTRFTRAYTPNAVCSPARASLMTGLLPHNHGVLWVHHCVDADQGLLRLDKPHWAMLLQKAGYATGYFGKWHVENTEKPSDFGWQVDGSMHSSLYTKFKSEIQDATSKLSGPTTAATTFPKSTQPASTAEPVYSNPVFHNNIGYDDRVFYGVTNIPAGERPMGITVSLALDFLEKKTGQEKPWCCFVSVPEPHDPFICGQEAYKLNADCEVPVPPNWNDELHGKPNIYRKASSIFGWMSEEEKKDAARHYWASITEIDYQFGRIFAYLKQKDQLDNTLIICTTDHGECLGAHGVYCKNIGAWEEIYSIPLIISGPGIAPGVETTARVGLHDIAPTIAEYCGLSSFGSCDGRSFLPVLMDPRTHENSYAEGFAEYHGGRYLLTQRVYYRDQYKFVLNGFDYDELYDLENDPHEMVNLAQKKEYQSLLVSMVQALWQKVRETGDTSLYNSGYPILRLAPVGPEKV